MTDSPLPDAAAETPEDYFRTIFAGITGRTGAEVLNKQAVFLTVFEGIGEKKIPVTANILGILPSIAYNWNIRSPNFRNATDIITGAQAGDWKALYRDALAGMNLEIPPTKNPEPTDGIEWYENHAILAGLYHPIAVSKTRADTILKQALFFFAMGLQPNTSITDIMTQLGGYKSAPYKWAGAYDNFKQEFERTKAGNFSTWKETYKDAIAELSKRAGVISQPASVQEQAAPAPPPTTIIAEHQVTRQPDISFADKVHPDSCIYLPSDNVVKTTREQQLLLGRDTREYWNSLIERQEKRRADAKNLLR